MLTKSRLPIFALPLLLVSALLLIPGGAFASGGDSDNLALLAGSESYLFVSGGTCTISQQCAAGRTISCTGQAGTCTSGSNYVQCNGINTYCPYPPCSAHIQCPYGGFISCYTDSGDCEEGYDYVTCTPHGTFTCDECYPGISCSYP